MSISAGVVEGFYGEPWSHQDRVRLLTRFPELGFDTYYYAPKDDPYHRERWREPYPASPLRRIHELARCAQGLGGGFVMCLAPGLSMDYVDPDERSLLLAKVHQAWQAGVRQFAILFDDVPAELSDGASLVHYGPGAGGLGLAHGELCAWLGEQFRLRYGITTPLRMCPTDYAGLARTPYREALSGTLPDDAVVMWTGADVVVGTVTEQDVRDASAAFGRRLLLWDNFPVNDFDRTRVFLGPLQGRPAAIAGLPLDGIIANPMVEAAPSLMPLATVGIWARDPSRYDPGQALTKAMELAGPFADQLRPLVRACASWPPSAIRDPELAALVQQVRSGGTDPRAALERRLRELAGLRVRLPKSGLDVPDAIAAGLRPWLRAGRLAGRLGLAALRATHAGPATAREVDLLSRALARYQSQDKDVLSPILIPWAESVLPH